MATGTSKEADFSSCIIVASFRISFSLIGSHFSDRSASEIWSYFLSPRIIRPAKFWTFYNLSILLLLVLLQTVEQYWKTKEFITSNSVFLSRRCLILLICFNLIPGWSKLYSFLRAALCCSWVNTYWKQVKRPLLWIG